MKSAKKKLTDTAIFYGTVAAHFPVIIFCLIAAGWIAASELRRKQ